MANLKFTEDGREIISVYKYGYEYILHESKPRIVRCLEHKFPQPCFMGQYNFGLHACRKISSVQLKKLNFTK